MLHSNFMLFYVESAEVSAAFYAELLDREPVESAPTFALFALESGLKLGLWSRHTVEPAATASGGGAELAFTAARLGFRNRTFQARSIALFLDR